MVIIQGVSGGLAKETIAEVERAGDFALVQYPLNPEVLIRVGPDPDWEQRLGEAWNETLINSRREVAGTILINDGQLAISEADTPDNAVTVQVVPGEYEVTFVIAHVGAKGTGDYEEHVSHAFALLKGSQQVTSIEPLTDEHEIELGIDAYTIAFAAAGVLQQIAGDHLGRWTLRIGNLFHPKSADGHPSSLNAVRVLTDDASSAAIMLYGGYGRDDYPLYKIVDVDGKTVGVMADFFVDNRPDMSA